MPTSYLDIGAVQSSGLPSIGAVQAQGGSTAVNKTLTDNLDANLQDTLLLGLGLILAETLSFSDSIFVPEPLAGVIIVDASWVNVLSDTQQYEVDLWTPYSDTLSLTDTFFTAPGLIIPSESLTLSDTVSAFAGVGITIAESFTFSDAISTYTLGVLKEAFSDSLTFTDAVIAQRIGNQTINFFGVLGQSNSIRVNGYSYPATGDKFNFADTFSTFMQSPFGLSDSVVLSDSITVNLGSTLNLTETLNDTLNLTDTPNYFAAYVPTYNDTLGLIDNITIQLIPQSIVLVLSDDFAFNDSVQRMATGLEVIASVQDDFFFQDSVIIQSTQSLNSYIRRYLNDVSIN